MGRYRAIRRCSATQQGIAYAGLGLQPARVTPAVDHWLACADIALWVSGAGARTRFVELTPKAPRRLLVIVRAWRRARHVDRILYLCPPGPTQRAVERAIEGAYAQERVIVRELRAAT